MNINKISISLLFAIFFITINVYAQDAINQNKGEAITWYSFADGVAQSTKTKKKVFIDVYTDWCGWCKKMDASTFVDPEVVKYMNENFIAIKLDAEQKEEIIFNGYTFKHLPGGRSGVHELAHSLLNGNMGYPAFVFLDQDFKRIRISPGYKQAPQMVKELKYAKEELYKTVNYELYESSND